MSPAMRTCTLCGAELPEEAFYAGKARCKACLLSVRTAADPLRPCGDCGRMLERAKFRRYARRCLRCEEGLEPEPEPEPEPEIEPEPADEPEPRHLSRKPTPEPLSPGVVSYLRRLAKNTHWRAKGLHRKRFEAGGEEFAFDVNAEFCEEMWRGQGGLCALSGQPMTTELGVGPEHRLARTLNASIDRVDSARNYARNNVHLVCSAVNVMKAQLSMPEFRRLCRLVADRG